MRVRGIRWLHAPSARYAETVAFVRDALGLALLQEDDELAVFAFANGDIFEVFGPRAVARDHAFMTAPVAGFEVEDVGSARAELHTGGVELVGPLHERGTSAWCYFRGPDGHVYELTTRR
jgi:catechol 2,3-dioxygenase-like lactoylglutathione lyase family enzyme